MTWRFNLQRAFVLYVALVSPGCGYFQSGTWTDDPKNFKRAWGYSKPADVDLVHSWYWRSPHFTREEAYFFQFRWHEELLRQLIAANGMRQVSASRQEKTETPQFCFQKPQWFAPKTPEAYQHWRCREGVDCWFFQDRQTKDIYLYACQM